MRKMLTALALSSLFAAAPALAAHKKIVAKPASTAPVAKAEGDAPKADEKAPAEKPAKKHVKKTKTTKTEAAPEAPAK